MKINVPILKQERKYTCLPACIRIVLNYFNLRLSESEISKACHTTKAGTRLNDAITAIESFGSAVTLIQEGRLEDLFQSILEQKPVITIIGVEHYHTEISVPTQ